VRPPRQITLTTTCTLSPSWSSKLELQEPRSADGGATLPSDGLVFAQGRGMCILITIVGGFYSEVALQKWLDVFCTRVNFRLTKG
jgi:hypothetical protein